MAVKTVTNANLAEYVAERQDKQAQAQAGVVVADKAAPVTGVVGSGEETIAPTPPPTDAKPTAQVKAEQEKSGKAELPETVPYSRFKEVNDKNKELDEFAQGEYEGRLTAQKRISELEAEVKKLKPIEPKVEEEVKPPDPKAFTVQAEYDKAVEQYQNALIDKRVAVKLAAEREAERQQKALELMDARAQQTAQEIGDYWDVMRVRGEASFEAAPPYIKAAIVEWETGPKLAYHLAKNQAEMKRIYAMPPIKAMEALAVLDRQYAKVPAEQVAETPPPAPPPVTTRAPAPVSAIKPSGELVPGDLSGPMPYHQYKSGRLAQQRQRKLEGRK